MKQKPRAAIITPYGLFNYGNRLQNYAVNSTFAHQGYDVETLILKPKYPEPVLRDLALDAGHRLGLRRHVSAKYKAFLEFDRVMAKRRVWSNRHLARLGAYYDLFVCGSDQIWNPYRSNLNGAEFGDFAFNSRKIALSPSFGVAELPAEATESLNANLRGFHSLSVREHAGQTIIEKYTGRRVPVLIDPTMSIDAEEWRAISSIRMRPQKPFLFVYLLGDYERESTEAIEEYAALKGLEIVQVMRRDLPRYFSAGPQDFLGLIDGASEVLADSFHAAVFALMFGTDFRLMPRPGLQSMKSRFDTLIQLFSLQTKPVDGYEWEMLIPPFDFDVKLAEQRRAYENFVSRALVDR